MRPYLLTLVVLLGCRAHAVGYSSTQTLTNSSVQCVSAYATPLGVLGYRHSISIQTQYDATPIWVGGPQVTTCVGCPTSISDGGFVDGGPGQVGEMIAAGGYMTKDISPGSGPAMWCIKASGAEDGTFDGGWTVITELP